MTTPALATSTIVTVYKKCRTSKSSRTLDTNELARTVLSSGDLCNCIFSGNRLRLGVLSWEMPNFRDEARKVDCQYEHGELQAVSF